MERRAFRIGDRWVDGGELLERGMLLVCAVLAVILPVLDTGLPDTSDDILLHDFSLLGGATYLMLATYAAAFFGVFALAVREHMRFIDLAGLIMAAIAVSRAVYLIGWVHLPVTVDEGGLASVPLTGFHLSYGSVPLFFLLFGSLWQMRRSWRG
ncbi:MULTISPECIES: hypothetical protein [unclassified Rhizobium]|uniref:hypothetical protein n=1 Tax=unclassified Rhizobium TaxID=2613769 RepID=UPI001ADAF262|nr:MULTISPECIES: hypothetical protein [unclassified Rhizobium]MBO9122753.1 hypothetical protein [Rhizobium sp. 16-488-2b]MBO9173285.1 hypothetical protein [Rhizobium sp. 16-488-2a]